MSECGFARSHQNLLRWSLKLRLGSRLGYLKKYQNLLRWSLKLWLCICFLMSVTILEFTPLEFEAGDYWQRQNKLSNNQNLLHWSLKLPACYFLPCCTILEFTPLEFETGKDCRQIFCQIGLEFTPLEFETSSFLVFHTDGVDQNLLRWSLKPNYKGMKKIKKKLEFTPLEFETISKIKVVCTSGQLEFTPLEFETKARRR